MTTPVSPIPTTNEGSAVTIVLKRRSHAEQIADRCVHFSGIQNAKCEAGVSYADVEINHAPIQYRRDGGGASYSSVRSLPCHTSMNLGGATCEKRCAPTAEAIAEQEAAAEREINAVFAARARIVEATNGARGVSGTVECPMCSKPLHYSVAGSNGHVHARCETQGCIAWME